VLALSVTVLVGPSAQACGLGEDCSGDGSTSSAPSSGTQSSPTQYASYSTPAMSCSVYANGAGMGSYCVSGDSGTVQTLRERFGKQTFQRCRYSEVPKSLPTPYDNHDGQGRYMLMTCIDNVDFDTYDGGPRRTVSVNVVWVPEGTDVSDHHNGITDFIWHDVEAGAAQLPVPFLRTRPNSTPVVGYPTYFTFRWVDPTDKSVVAEGPYTGRADGGPYKQISSNGLVIRATGQQVKIDPHQQGIPSTTCPADTPYKEGAKPSEQPADACKITFPRSSASARKYATDKIPANVKDAFYASVEVEWRVTYGGGGAMQQLGSGFTMRVRQIVPVQEVQGANDPPTVIY
jgi:hypothetical protein